MYPFKMRSLSGSGNPIFANKAYVTCHLTTAHKASDVRIFERECKSISDKTNFGVILIAHGEMPSYDRILHVPLGEIPKSRIGRMVKSQVVSIRSLLKIKADLWHIHDPELLLFGSLLVLLKRKVIWDAHEDYYLQFKQSDKHRTYIPKYLRNGSRKMIFGLLSFLDKRAIAVISATNSISDTYQNKNKVVVGNEARIEDFELCNPQYVNNRVLFTGAADQSQCFLEVVRAISNIDNLVLTLAGVKPSPNDWAIAKNELGERLIYLGWLNRLELSDAISKSKIGLLTYSDHETNRTNAPNKRFEFSAGGLPCVATPTESNQKWAAESSGAIVADGFTAADISKALNTLNDSELLWQKTSISSREWSREFGSWTNSEIELLNVYKNTSRYL
jgi:glycosyltransferase involved in cell wall biosynthesis